MQRLRHPFIVLSLLFLPLIFSCKKDANEPIPEVQPEGQPEPKDLGLSTDYLGDWYLYSRSFRRNIQSPNYDSILVYNTQSLGLTFTDSLLYIDSSNYPYWTNSNYHCIEYLYGSPELFEWQGASNNAHLNRTSDNSYYRSLSFLDYHGTKDNEDLQFVASRSPVDQGREILGKVPGPIRSDSVTYILQFYTYMGPLEGLIVSYIGNDGSYETDTLADHQWNWEKTIKQTSLEKIYALELVGVTDDYHEGLIEDFYGKFDLIIEYQPYSRPPNPYRLQDIVECNITTSGEFNTESRLGYAGHLRYYELYVE